MFTGIVEEAGQVLAVRPGSESIRLMVRSVVCGRGLAVGDSVAVNGCCLTVVRRARRGGAWHLHFDLLKETWQRTNLSLAKPGVAVNLERSLAVNGRLDGHFVTGHVDGVGRIARWERVGRDHVLDIAAPAPVMKYVVMKGAIAVDGISLTVAEVKRDRFRVWIIPHTREVTALRERSKGDRVNLEADLLGKYVERFLRGRRSSRKR